VRRDRVDVGWDDCRVQASGENARPAKEDDYRDRRVRETEADFDQALCFARSTAARIGLHETDIASEDVVLDDRYHAGCYGIPDATTIEAIRFGAATEAFITDPVYEGKSLAGLMDMVRRGEIAPGTNVLYAHLGGQLALSAYSSLA